MIEKTKKIIISFHSLSDALKLEKYCKLEKIKGRLIPIPREISAGCGMAWASEINLKENLLIIIDKYKIEYGEYFEIMK